MSSTGQSNPELEEREPGESSSLQHRVEQGTSEVTVALGERCINNGYNEISADVALESKSYGNRLYEPLCGGGRLQKMILFEPLHDE